MTSDRRRLVLIVDTDSRFIADARGALVDHRVLSVQTLDEATEVVLGGRVDLVVFGPAFASDVAISQATTLHDADPNVALVLVADVTTNRLLKSALRGGFADVLDAPLRPSDIADLVDQLPARPEVTVVVEPQEATPMPTSVPAALHTEAVAVSFDAEPASPRDSQPQGQQMAPVPQPGPAPTVPAQPYAMEHPAPEPAPVAHPQPAPPAWPAVPPAGAAPNHPGPPHPPSNVLDQVLPPVPMAPPPATWAPAPPSTAQPIPEPVPAPQTPPVVRRSGGGQVIAVMAGKGGSGKTVVATNLAIAMGMRNDPERVALVDADLQFGDVALLLQLSPVRTLDDVVGYLDEMSDERLDAALLRHESGVRVLPAPVLPVGADEIDSKQIIEVVERLRMMYDTVVVDTGPLFDEGLVAMLEYADAVVSVVDMDLPSVKNAKVALDRLRHIGFDMDRIRLVVNRANSKARLDLAELERSLGLRVEGSIPSDRLVPQSVNEGIPILSLNPRSKVARAFHVLAEALEPSWRRGHR